MPVKLGMSSLSVFDGADEHLLVTFKTDQSDSSANGRVSEGSLLVRESTIGICCHPKNNGVEIFLNAYFWILTLAQWLVALRQEEPGFESWVGQVGPKWWCAESMRKRLFIKPVVTLAETKYGQGNKEQLNDSTYTSSIWSWWSKQLHSHTYSVLKYWFQVVALWIQVGNITCYRNTYRVACFTFHLCPPPGRPLQLPDVSFLE